MGVVNFSQETTKNYKSLLVWQKAVSLAVKVYNITSKFPKNQQYSLISQMQRAAVSVSSNIAEGAGRKGKKEFMQHLSIARGSLYELETQLIISNQINFLSDKELTSFADEIEEIGRMLNGLRNSLRVE